MKASSVLMVSPAWSVSIGFSKLEMTASFLGWFLNLFAITINQKLWNLVYLFLIILFFPSCSFVFLFFPWSLSDGCLLPSCKTQHDHWYMWSVSFIFPSGVVSTIILFTYTYTYTHAHIHFLDLIILPSWKYAATNINFLLERPIIPVVEQMCGLIL